MEKPEEQLFFSNFVAIISILLAILLFIEGNFASTASSLNSTQNQLILSFHLNLITLYRVGSIVGALITLSVLRILFSTEFLLKRKWFKKHQFLLYIILDIILVCLLIPIFLWLNLYTK